MMEQTLILRANTVVRTFSGKSVTLFELSGWSNIIRGYSHNEATGELIQTPVKIKVDKYAFNESFFGLDKLKVIQFNSGEKELSIVSDNLKINVIDGNFYLENMRIRSIDSSKEEIENTPIQIQYNTETRIYYKVVFELVKDVLHNEGDKIYIYLNDGFLLHKWHKN